MKKKLYLNNLSDRLSMLLARLEREELLLEGYTEEYLANLLVECLVFIKVELKKTNSEEEKFFNSIELAREELQKLGLIKGEMK